MSRSCGTRGRSLDAKAAVTAAIAMNVIRIMTASLGCTASGSSLMGGCCMQASDLGLTVREAFGETRWMTHACAGGLLGHRRSHRILVALTALASSGCMFREPPNVADPIVINPLAQAASCTMLAMGSDLVNAPVPSVSRPPGARLEQLACHGGPARERHPSSDFHPPERGSMWVAFDGDRALVTTPDTSPPRGVVVVFAGLSMSPEAPILRDLADRLADRGFIVARKLRHETVDGVAPRKLRLDPVSEARGGISLGRQLADRCETKHVEFVGMSLGGAEALIAAREAPGPTVVIDPLIDLEATVQWLRGGDLRHPKKILSLSREVMLEFFRLVIHGRYGVAGTLGDALANADLGETVRSRDMPHAWLSGVSTEWREGMRVFLSAWDPVLGDKGRELLDPNVIRRIAIEGHIPIYCDRDSMRRVVDAVASCYAGVCTDRVS